jgi:type IV pilus assembly protein PilN
MNNINLLPWREENKKKYQKLFNLEIVAVIVFTLVCIIFLHLVRSSQSNFYSTQNALIQDEIQKLTAENAQLAPFKETQKTLEKNINAAFSFQYHRFVGIKMLNAITPIIPKDIYLTQIKFSHHATQIQGNATSNIAISNLVERIDRTGLFIPAKINEVTEEKYNNLNVTKFLITAELNTLYDTPTPEKKP